MTTTTSTTLNLLTRDGAVRVNFTPALTAAQYEELLAIVDHADRIVALATLLENAAKSWQRQIAIDPC